MSSMDNRSTAGGKLESKSLKKNVSKMAFRSKEMVSNVVFIFINV